MEIVNAQLEILERTPAVLSSVLREIPAERVPQRRVETTWSIHEQVCHLVDAQAILIARFEQLAAEEDPLIASFHPPPDQRDDHYARMDLQQALRDFPEIRRGMLRALRSHPPAYWDRTGRHEVFEPYGTRILLTHAINVDYAHLFSIEQLGLTKPGFEDGILTIP